MKLKYKFVIRKIGDNSVAVTVGDDNAKFNGMIKLNDTAELIFSKLINGESSVENIVDAILEKYDIERETATKSVTDFINVLREDGLLYD